MWREKRQSVLAAVVAGLLVGGFGLGATGLPGKALWAAFDWAVDNGYVVLTGPVGDAVRGALG